MTLAFETDLKQLFTLPDSSCAWNEGHLESLSRKVLGTFLFVPKASTIDLRSLFLPRMQGCYAYF